LDEDRVFRSQEKNKDLLGDVFQQKGKKHVSIPVTGRAKKVLESGFPERIALQNLNDYIKKVVKAAKIDELIDGKKYDSESKRKVFAKYPKYELITSHVCRRSFATNYYKKIPTTVIMGITGHVKESTFLQYIGKPKDKDENARIFLKYVNDRY
jgi:integrase